MFPSLSHIFLVPLSKGTWKMTYFLPRDSPQRFSLADRVRVESLFPLSFSSLFFSLSISFSLFLFFSFSLFLSFSLSSLFLSFSLFFSFSFSLSSLSLSFSFSLLFCQISLSSQKSALLIRFPFRLVCSKVVLNFCFIETL